MQGFIMFKRDDYLLEYVHHKRQFRHQMWSYVAMWAVLRTLRTILIFTVGLTFLSSIPAALIFWASGLVFGLAIHTIIVFRSSVRVDHLDAEAERLKE